MYSTLSEKKSKLFDGRVIEKWGTPASEFKEPLDQIMRDFHLASKYILPKETQKIDQAREIQSYLSLAVYHEYILFNKRDQRRIVKNFQEYAKKVRKSTRSEEVIWNIFEKIMPVDQNSPEKERNQIPGSYGTADVYANSQIFDSRLE